LGGAGSPSNMRSSGPRSTSLPSGILIHPAISPQQAWTENGGLCHLGGAGSPSNTIWPGPGPIPTPSGNPSTWMATTDMHQKLEQGCAPWGELGPHLTRCRLGRSIRPYCVAFCSIQPFGHNIHGRKMGGYAPLAGLGPHLTRCGQGRGLPPYPVASSSSQPFTTTDMGRKLGGCAPLGGAGSPPNTVV